MTFNIQHGIDGTVGRYNLQNAIDTIARSNVDIVGLQELTRNHPFYNCDDQPALLAAGVSAATGQRWDVVYQQEWFTADVSCQQAGRGDGKETEGLGFLSRRAIGSSAATTLPFTRIGLTVPVRDAYDLPIVVTHLASGSGNSGQRMQELSQLLGWTASFGQARVLMGDFNARPESGEMQPVFGSYHEAWTDAQAIGHALGNPQSHNGTRIDYIFYTPGPNLSVSAAEVIDTRSLIGVDASDHSPVVATFVVR
jgi:endonuclease/exonuclease/phosphatase family metal-dependent hydrolase